MKKTIKFCMTVLLIGMITFSAGCKKTADALAAENFVTLTDNTVGLPVAVGHIVVNTLNQNGPIAEVDIIAPINDLNGNGPVGQCEINLNFSPLNPPALNKPILFTSGLVGLQCAPGLDFSAYTYVDKVNSGFDPGGSITITSINTTLRRITGTLNACLASAASIDLAGRAPVTTIIIDGTFTVTY